MKFPFIETGRSVQVLGASVTSGPNPRAPSRRGRDALGITRWRRKPRRRLSIPLTEFPPPVLKAVSLTSATVRRNPTHGRLSYETATVPVNELAVPKMSSPTPGRVNSVSVIVVWNVLMFVIARVGVLERTIVVAVVSQVGRMSGCLPPPQIRVQKKKKHLFWRSRRSPRVRDQQRRAARGRRLSIRRQCRPSSLSTLVSKRSASRTRVSADADRRPFSSSER